MIKQNKLLVTIVATVLLGAGAVAVASKSLSSQGDSKQATSSSATPTAKDTSWRDNAVSEGKIADSADAGSSASSSSSAASSNNEQSSSSRSSSSSSNTSSNTLTEDDFRESDDMAYRMIALYGLMNGDASWKALQSASTITFTRQSDSVPTFVATGSNGSTTKAYYRYVMSSSDTESQKKPLSFSKDDASQYRATVSDVLNCANANGGRATIEKLNFKLVN
ncbi:hypothetical protein LNP00_00470 [Fructobacillus sp. M158]|uniref:hypothetical protein n=1 Tax=Fructobacillus parabroussonetiae TaxID=2713174 RepID=UPI00200A6C58|nr:hypothetical protein [Fructobacillus parabroussonetiae]MCK8616845.1 hypothetical protein [Fructobacillus parabroussonetiae]